ncbi:sugar transferase [Arthrobacter sp. UYP6]|uniref:sugar transferase n=1 Tax=Arthrobacter sp. UYP6 TaxID=1756378 RepID=UPI003392410F
MRGRPTSDHTKWTSRYRKILLAVDASMVISVLALAHIVRFGLNQSSVDAGSIALPYTLVSAFIVCAWMAALSAYRSRDGLIVGHGMEEYRRVVGATMTLLGCLAMVCLIFGVDISRGFFAIAIPSGVFGLVASRWILRQWLVAKRARGRYLFKVVVLGKAKDVKYVANQIQRKAGSGYRVVGVALTSTEGKPRYLTVNGQSIPVVADMDSVVSAVRETRADAVIVAGSMKGGASYVQELGWELEESATQLILTTGLTNVAGPRIHSRPVEGLPLMHVELPQYTGARHVLKRSLDIALSGLALVMLLPVFLILALLIKRDSHGPVIFRQERVGRGGEKFLMYKFRSMVETAEDDLAGLLDRNEGDGLLFKIQMDPRVTNVGRWMRKYSLDELPQFWNVFLGHMSLVGPRPPLQGEVDRYKNRVHRRLYIKPGITGMWQTNGRSELNWKDGVRLDLYYVENWSLAGDLIILWRTVVQMFRPVGAY